MQSIEVITSQNVKISYPVASVGDRILAYIIDYLIIMAIYMLGSFVFDDSYFYQNYWILIVIILFPILFYHLIFEILMNGQSPGKKVLNIKVVKLDGGRPELSDYLLRWLLRIIDISFTSGIVAIITIIANQKGQRLGDMAAGTSVIKLNSVGHIASIPIEQEFSEPNKVEFHQASLLDETDIDLIYRSIMFYNQTKKTEPIHVLTDKIVEKMKVSVPATYNKLEFLKQVAKDYNEINSK